jgi:hypothetical protein
MDERLDIYGRVCRCVRKFRKAAISFVMSVCLSVRSSVHMEQLGFHWTRFQNPLSVLSDFHTAQYPEIIRASSDIRTRDARVWTDSI